MWLVYILAYDWLSHLMWGLTANCYQSPTHYRLTRRQMGGDHPVCFQMGHGGGRLGVAMGAGQEYWGGEIGSHGRGRPGVTAGSGRKSQRRNAGSHSGSMPGVTVGAGRESQLRHTGNHSGVRPGVTAGADRKSQWQWNDSGGFPLYHVAILTVTKQFSIQTINM